MILDRFLSKDADKATKTKGIRQELEINKKKT